MKKPLFIALAALVLLIVFLIAGKKMGWIGKEIREKVTVEKAVLRTLTESITANGKIKPETEVKISSDVSGEIIELMVKEGDEVVKGQILARIQPDIYQRNLERTEAAVKNSEANLTQAQAQLLQRKLAFNRTKELFEQKAIPQSEFEQVEAEFNIAQANVASAEASLRSASASRSEARDNLNKTTIYAPMGGTISRLNVEKGERVVGTAQFSGTEMMTLANLNMMEVMVDVNENDIIRVKKGDTCLIEVDAYLKKKFKGLVTQIANSANVQGTSTDQITNFEVRILVLPESYADLINEGNSYPFRPGMSATVEIQTKTMLNILTIPLQSVTMRSDSLLTDTVKVKSESQDKKIEVAFVVIDGKVQQRKVETGIQDSKFIQITNGVSEGDEVVSGPFSAISRKLKDGDLVEKTENLTPIKKDKK
jgi:HlyD family secretion protein